MADHSPKVKQAILAALNDINLLRALVNAQNDDAKVNTVLTNYDPKYHLESNHLEEFVHSLREGKIECTVSGLVDYYDALQPPKVVKADTRQEWTP
jgi:hypothetical protein